MVELFQNFWFLLFGMIAVISVAGTLAQAWSKVRRMEQEAALKHEMLRRGLSADEIERLLRANSKPQDEAEPGGTEEVAVGRLAKALGECAASPQIIEQVMAAVRAADPPVR